MIDRLPTTKSTAIVTQAPTASLPAVRSDLPYSLEKDLAPIALVTSAPFLLVAHVSVPADDVKSLIAYARANPGKLN